MNLSLMICALCASLLLLTCVKGAPSQTGRIDFTECKTLSATLNEKARNISERVLRSNFSNKINDPPARIEIQDNCDPHNLRENNKPCLAKVVSALKTYSSIFRDTELFKATTCERYAGDVEDVVRKLLATMKELPPSPSANPTGPQMPCGNSCRKHLCRDIMDRLHSFSIAATRIFSFLSKPSMDSAPQMAKC